MMVCWKTVTFLLHFQGTCWIYFWGAGVSTKGPSESSLSSLQASWRTTNPWRLRCRSALAPAVAPRPPRRQTWRRSADRWGMSGVNHPKSCWWTVREAYTQKIVFVSAKSRVIDKIEKIDVILMYVNIFFNYSRIYQYDMIHRYMLLHLHLYNLPKWVVSHGAGFLPWTQVRVNSCNFSKHVLK